MRRSLLFGMRAVATVLLGALSALHVLWGCGSAWPAPDRKSLADAVGGFADFPRASACLVVATFLGLCALAVAGVPKRMERAWRFGSAATSLVFLFRGSVGLAGAMPNARRSLVFAQLDRRVYSPICLIIGAAAIAGARQDE